MSLTKVSYSMIRGAKVSIFDFLTPAQINGVQTNTGTDVTAAFQAAIDALYPQYSTTMMNGNYNSLLGTLKTLYFPAGTYIITSTINMQFRNYMTLVGESQYNTIIAGLFPTSGINTMLDCKAANYLSISKLTLDGRFKCSNMIYCAGIDAAHTYPGSKGNVTGNEFSHLFMWNQPGDLTCTADFPDQYDVRSAMLCLTTDSGADTSFYSCDDSYISYCRFATNNCNNYFAMALSSSNLQIQNCTVFAANGVLLSNGCSATFQQMAWEIYGYQAIDATHNHAVLKCTPDTGGNLDAFGQGTIILTDCYSESGWNGAVQTTAILAYMTNYTGGGTGDSIPKFNLIVKGGLYASTLGNVSYISIGTGNRANIHITNASFQGTYQPLIYAPSSSVYVEDQSFVNSASTGNYQTWNVLSPSSCTSFVRKFTTADYVVSGESSPNVTAYVGNTDYPAQLRFLSLDAALLFLSTSNANVSIILQKNDTITNPINLKSNLTFGLAGFTLTVNAIIQNFGNLLIDGGSGGVCISTNRKIYNFGTLNIINATINALVSSLGGVTNIRSCIFAGTNNTIEINETSQVIIAIDGCTFSGSEYVIGLTAGYGNAIIRSATTTTPATGKWARGTKFETTLPASGSPVAYWATSNGVGASANWKSNGNLA